MTRQRGLFIIIAGCGRLGPCPANKPSLDGHCPGHSCRGRRSSRTSSGGGSKKTFSVRPGSDRQALLFFFTCCCSPWAQPYSAPMASASTMLCWNSPRLSAPLAFPSGCRRLPPHRWCYARNPAACTLTRDEPIHSAGVFIRRDGF